MSLPRHHLPHVLYMEERSTQLIDPSTRVRLSLRSRARFSRCLRKEDQTLQQPWEEALYFKHLIYSPGEKCI